ncbi:MAG: hypothetical protein V4449_01970 [Patescibacteria group bacterium]
MNSNKIFKRIFFVLIGIFALIGVLFSGVFVAMQFGLLNVRGAVDERNAFFGKKPDAIPCLDMNRPECVWNKTPEWETVKGGLLKDTEIIARVSSETGVSKRMIATVVIPEQIRFFTSEREVFKSYFEPLKILGSLSQFSLGVSGIKQETANMIELNAQDSSSPFYPGSAMQALIAYPAGVEHDVELYRRLTDPKDHYYSYLYTALYIKEIQAQWKRAGYDITQNPDVVGTLFNIGFQKSNPNPSPVTGGAAIQTGGKTYLFGELGALFYYSDELVDVFPK